MATKQTAKEIGGEKKAPKQANKANTSTRTISIEEKKKRLITALTRCLGVVTDACKAAKVGRTAFYEYLKNDPEFKKQVDEITNISIDFTESKMFQLIAGYSHREDKVFIVKGKPVIVPTMKHYAPDAQMIKLYLTTKGKDRGYTQTVINVNKNVDEMENATDDELDAKIQQLEAKLRK